MRSLWLCTALIVATVACESTTSTSDTSPAPDGPPSGAWGLSAFELASGQVIPVEDTSRYTLELTEDRLHVRADCNVCSGGYALADGIFDVGLLACTLVACPAGSLESRYLRALESASALELEGASLRIVYDEGVMRFSRF